MFDIIPIVLIIISLGVILYIVLRKFPELANLDVEGIQAEREARFKEQIIGKKLKRVFGKHFSAFSKIAKPGSDALGNFLNWSHKRLVDYKEDYKREKMMDIETETQSEESMFLEIDELIKDGNQEEAEKKYIEIISQNSKSIEAFKGLGKLYLDKKSHVEAKQTLEHAIRLTEKDLESYGSEGDSGERIREYDSTNLLLASMYFDLSLVNRVMEDFELALVNIDKALSIQPNNPRYLDTKLEISIINKDSDSAKEAFKRLKKVNPENQKLPELKKQIKEL